jgi:CHAD domain-containing protein
MHVLKRPQRAAAVTITAESLGEPTQLGVRIVGRALLGRLREKSEHLGADDHPDALHDFRVAVRRLRSWARAFDDDLSTTLRPKAQRRLKRIADATRASRDFEVHIEWLERFARSRKGRYREATEWLVERARDRKARADLDLQEVLNENLERTTAQLTQGLSHYVVSLDEPSDPFSVALASLIREHANAARRATARIGSIGDRNEAHEARIAAKRLRYLLEPLSGAGVETQSLVERLAKLQDDLGALHDAQIFGSEIAGLLAKELRTRRRSSRNNGDNPGSSASAVDRADALRAISQRLHRDEVAAFRRLKESWLDADVESVWREAETIAARLENKTRSAQRSVVQSA